MTQKRRQHGAVLLAFDCHDVWTSYGYSKASMSLLASGPVFGDHYNQTARTIAGVTSTLTYDYENRLTSVSGGSSATFLHDANDNRGKGTVDGVTTVYIAGLYEWQAGATTTYIEGPTGIIVPQMSGCPSPVVSRVNFCAKVINS